MINFYVRGIESGRMKLEDVPEKWRSGVEEQLKKLGLLPKDNKN